MIHEYAVRSGQPTTRTMSAAENFLISSGKSMRTLKRKLHSVQEKTCTQLHPVQGERMSSTTQYRITGTEDGQKWGTKWNESLSELSDTRWAKMDGVKIESRILVQEESYAEHLAMKRQGAKVVRCSRHEIAAMARDAMKRGVAFAAQPIGGCNYKVMEIS